MTLKNILLTFTAAVALAGFSSSANAQILNYVTYTDSSNGNHTDDGANNYDMGTLFTVGSQNINVVSLGAWGGSGILNSTHVYSPVLTLPVATTAYLWSSTGTLLASATIAAGTTATDASTVAGQGFAFATLSTPVTLTAGSSYYVTSDTQGGATKLGYTRLSSSEYTVGSAVSTNGLGQFALSQGSFPNFNNNGNATFGGDFQYTVGSSSPVPEPSTYALLLGSFVLLAVVVRRKNSVVG